MKKTKIILLIINNLAVRNIKIVQIYIIFNQKNIYLTSTQ